MRSEGQTAPPREGSLLPAFTLPTTDGREVRVRAFRGRRSLAIFFVHGTDCAACTQTLSDAVARYDAYAAEDAEVIAVVPAEPTQVAALRAGLAAPYPVLVDQDAVVFERYRLQAGTDAAVLVTDRYGEPRRWWTFGLEHDAMPSHEALLAELGYLAISCGGGCGLPAWPDAAT